MDASPYSSCRTFTKNKEQIQKFNQTGDSKYINQNEPDKTCFQHDMAYGGFKDLPRRTVADKILLDEAFNVAKNPRNNGYQHGLGSMFYKFFDWKNF